MLSLRRWLVAALLTVLVLGCEKKPKLEGVEETPEEHMIRKFKMAQDRPKGPQLDP
jgi:hypothetical protein